MAGGGFDRVETGIHANIKNGRGPEL